MLAKCGEVYVSAKLEQKVCGITLVQHVFLSMLSLKYQKCKLLKLLFGIKQLLKSFDSISVKKNNQTVIRRNK